MFHYTACGLSNIWLENGYAVTRIDADHESFSIEDINGLHQTIGKMLCAKESLLTGEEIRFLRTELGLSRKALGDQLGLSLEAIKKWESGDNTISKASDVLLRAIYLGKFDGNESALALLSQIKQAMLLAEQPRLSLRETDHGWTAEAA